MNKSAAHLRICAFAGHLRAAGAICSSLLIYSCANSPSSEETTRGSTRQAVSTQHATLPAAEVTVSVIGPRSSGALSTLVLASNSLHIGSRVEVRDAQQRRAPVANVGTGVTYVEPDTSLRSIFALGPAELRDRVSIEKDIFAASLVQGNNDSIGGKVGVSSTSDLAEALSWTVSFPAGSFPSYFANPEDTIDIEPGRYGSIRVGPRASLKLRSGTYQLESLDLEPESKVHVTSTPGQGPTVVYVRGQLIHRGLLQGSVDPANLALVHLGSESTYIESPLFGTLISPNSAVTLRQTTTPHRGAVIAKDITLDSGVAIEARPALSVLRVLPFTREDKCVAQVPMPRLPFTKDASVQFQYDLLRYCIAPDISDDDARIQALTSVDLTEAATRALKGTITFCQYVLFRMDRHRRMRMVEADPTLKAALSNGLDADDDFVPDTVDACPGTPILMPVDEQGCPKSITGCPWNDQATREKTLNSLALVSNPACVDQVIPAVAPAGWVALLGAGHAFFYVGKVENDHPGCPMLYEFELRMTDLATGKIVKELKLLFTETEASTTGAFAPLPEPFLQFHVSATDAGARGEVVQLRRSGLRGWFRVRAVNGQLAKGPYSAWRLTTVQDCNTLNFACSE